MRLRKNMKRTAAAVLALSMAVSAVAAPASAAYICDVSQGDVVVSRDESGKQTTITVGGVAVEDNGDGRNEIIITGDNTTKPTASLNAAEENAAEAEKSAEVEKTGENASEVEKSGETEEQAQEPGSLELLAPEDEQKKDEEKKDEQKPAETQETEQDKKPTDQVLLCGQNDPEAQTEATKLDVKQETKEKKAAEEKSYENNAPTSLSESVQAAANNVVKIINDSAKVLKVFLRDLKVDAGDTNKDAVTVSGTGNVTLELDGKNELKGGSYWSNDERSDSNLSGGHGLHAKGEGTLTIQDEDKNGSLTAAGGDVETSNLGFTMNGQWLNGGDGIRAKNLTVSGAEIKAEGGNSNVTGTSDVMSGGGAGIRVDEGTAKLLDDAHITAKGGDGYTDNNKDCLLYTSPSPRD